MSEMTKKERVVHMVLFEAFALATFVPLAMFITNEGAATMTGLSIGLSLIAMVWNLIYNWGFDTVFGHDRINRSFAMRLGHGAGFELGMIATSFPVLMLVLQKDFLTILWLDMGAVIFFFVFAIIFNWAYDVIRHARKSSETPAT